MKNYKVLSVLFTFILVFSISIQNSYAKDCRKASSLSEEAYKYISSNTSLAVKKT